MWQLRREQRAEPKDPAVVAYRRLCRRLAAIGLPRRPHEGAEGYAARVGRARPDLAAAAAALCESYTQLRYAQATPRLEEILREFIARARGFRPRRAHIQGSRRRGGEKVLP